MSAAANNVLTSLELLPTVFAYQDGLPRDFLPFTKLQLHKLWLRQNWEQWDPALLHALRDADDALRNWFKRYSVHRLPRLLASVPSMRIIVPLWVVYTGRLDLASILHKQFPTLMDESTALLHVAAAGGSSEMVQFLVECQYYRGSHFADTMRLAREYRHKDVATLVESYFANFKVPDAFLAW
ncbi:unnamed protein product [Aphanomyces euteiches]|uniref:Ankyrin repeat-containing domain n=1 Tax=Aphanomyces euteiches TaxID=100861 RepID=A0A6G0WGZ3_9STRA|nr:hypothetical protein Ae201684_015308 [Aphanomyces euteiches]KAH9072065.1 hypothetical protein Ae201684P_021202 [Aphanomyces euteiches]